jgi:hypothetical protein
MLRELRTQTSKFFDGSLDTHKIQYFDISKEVDKVDTIVRRMEAPLVKRIANGMDAMGKVFSNHLRLLGGKLSGFRVADEKIWNTFTKEDALTAQMGVEYRLEHQVTISNAFSEKTISQSLKNGTNGTKKEGISKQNFDY